MSDLLPRHQVGVVLHLGEQNFVARPQKLAAPRVGHQVDRHRRAGGEDDLFALCGPDEVADLGTGGFQFFVDLHAELIIAPVGVGVIPLVALPLFFDHRAGLLRLAALSR